MGTPATPLIHHLSITEARRNLGGRGTFALRMCIINHTTSWNDVRKTLEAVERFGREALSKSAAPA